jgi:tetratricopeptide (TPR) repeat protein
MWLANSDYSLDPDSKLGLAKPKYDKVVEKASADTVKYSKELFASYDFLGSYYLTVKPVDLDKATKIYQKIIALDPKNKTNLMKGYSGLALVAAKKKNYAGARDLFKTLLTLDPGNKDYQKAEETFEKQVKAVEAAANQ